MSRPTLARLGLSLLLIAATDVPWTSWQDHAHWDRIGRIPFVSPPVRIGDIALNIALFVPFGFYARKAMSRSWIPIAAATAVSLTCEFLQVFSHGRFPSATDVTCNVTGAILGVLIARRGHRAIRLRRHRDADA